MTAGKILISACLLGQKVRYDGSAKTVLHPALTKWQQEGRLVALCPKIAAGFATPRAPAEIAEGLNGEDVLTGKARVIDLSGADATHFFSQRLELHWKQLWQIIAITHC